MGLRSWLSGGDDPHPMESDYDALQASAARGSARFAARWGSSDTPDGYDHGLANPAIQAEHKAKMAGRTQGNGRTHVNIGTNTINQTDHLARKFQEKAQPVADALHKSSPTKANFNYGQPSSWNLDNMSSATFTANKPHGFPVGFADSFKGGEVEVISSTKVKVYIRIK